MKFLLCFLLLAIVTVNAGLLKGFGGFGAGFGGYYGGGPVHYGGYGPAYGYGHGYGYGYGNYGHGGFGYGAPVSVVSVSHVPYGGYHSYGGWYKK